MRHNSRVQRTVRLRRPAADAPRRYTEVTWAAITHWRSPLSAVMRKKRPTVSAIPPAPKHHNRPTHSALRVFLHDLTRCSGKKMYRNKGSLAGQPVSCIQRESRTRVMPETIHARPMSANKAPPTPCPAMSFTTPMIELDLPQNVQVPYNSRLEQSRTRAPRAYLAAQSPTR